MPIKSIEIKRSWKDDFNNFFENKEGLLSYSFVLELFERKEKEEGIE